MPHMPISEEEIRKHLASSLPVTVFDRIDSTNTEARRRLLDGATAPALFVANCQTAGRGRQGKQFYSPAEAGLYLSLLLPDCEKDAVPLTTLAAVAVRRALLGVTGISCGIKWVNDLYLGEKKVAGLLAEAILLPNGARAVVMGVGINVWADSFPDDLPDAGALFSGSAAPGEDLRSRLAAAVANEILAAAASADRGEWLEEYRRHSTVLGRRVYFIQNGVRYEGVAHGITEQGGLCVALCNGEERVLTSGEITLRALS